ncbi:hypothetical protein ACKS0A_01112 [Histoplasma ohiense]
MSNGLEPWGFSASLKGAHTIAAANKGSDSKAFRCALRARESLFHVSAGRRALREVKWSRGLWRRNKPTLLAIHFAVYM